MTRGRKAAVAVALAVGVGLLVLTRPAEDAVPTVRAPVAEAPAPPAAPADQSARVAELERQLEAERQTVKRAVETIRTLDEQVHSATAPGAAGPVPFPAGARAPYQPAGARAVAEAAARECGLGLEVLEVDCAEYPCLVWTRAAGPRVQRLSMDECQPWADAYQQGTMVFGTGFTAEGERVIAWLPVPPEKELVKAAVRRGSERARATAAGRYDFPAPAGEGPGASAPPKVWVQPSPKVAASGARSP